MPLNFRPPADDEFEVTLFGRGTGECCVLHLGGGQWAIIDSYNYEKLQRDPLTRRPRKTPIARWYLDKMGISSDQVKMILITHFDADHHRGVDLLHDHYHEAQLVVTTALRADLFKAIGTDPREPLGAVPATMQRAKSRRRHGYPDGLRYAGVNWQQLFADDVRLTALSPTDAVIHTATEQIAARMDTQLSTLRELLRNQNWCSVVVHFHTKVGCTLLGADLENSPRDFGWEAVLADPGHAQLSPADIVKVPHHGSPDADHEDIWRKFAVKDRHMFVAPFTATGGSKRPTTEDCARLCARGGSLWQAAPSVARTANGFGFDSEIQAPTGAIQARRTPTADKWEISIGGTAFRVC
ncbi:hypothetical protein [Mycobacterium sp. E2733]|uniref:hypothetical protein n=1 Tax=Mycobacterium sp. E2733 TaxID=1834138 RepID=UPI000B108D28|nr:hypothetical protein [Mycobacterium sp. E2733]